MNFSVPEPQEKTAKWFDKLLGGRKGETYREKTGKKPSKKKIILSVLAVLLIAAVVFGVYKLFFAKEEKVAIAVCSCGRI